MHNTMIRSKRQINVAAISALISAGIPLPCLAADSDNGSGQLPQFNPETFTPQLFWLAVAFGIAYIFFARKTLPEISSVFEKRHERIVRDRETAEKLSREDEEVQKAYEESLANAREEAQRLINESKQAVKEKAEQEHKAFREKYDQETKAMEERLDQAKQDAMQDINDIVTDVAVLSADKVAGVSLTQNEADRIVRQVLSETSNSKAA